MIGDGPYNYLYNALYAFGEADTPDLRRMRYSILLRNFDYVIDQLDGAVESFNNCENASNN